MRNWLRGIAIFLIMVTPVTVYLLWPTDEARIRKLLRQEAHAVEAKDIEAFMKGISFNYSDDYGMSYIVIKRVLKREFKREGSITITYGDILVEVRDDDTATAVMDISVTSSDSGPDAAPRRLLGGGQAPAVLNLTLEKGTTGNWIVRSSKWPPAF